MPIHLTAGTGPNYIPAMHGKARNLYIIDGHAHIYAAYFAPMRQQQRWTSPAGEPGEPNTPDPNPGTKPLTFGPIGWSRHRQ